MKKVMTSVVAFALSALMFGYARADVVSLVAVRNTKDIVVKGFVKGTTPLVASVGYTIYQWNGKSWVPLKMDTVLITSGNTQSVTVNVPQSTAEQRFRLQSGRGLIDFTLPAGEPPAEQPVTKVTAPLKPLGPRMPAAYSVVNFALANEDKKVGGGECTDLIHAALAAYGAKPMVIRKATAEEIAEGYADDNKEVYIWTGLLSHPNGRGRYSPRVGDIIQFERCVFKKPNSTEEWKMPHHTAIVANRGDGRKVVLLHQNYGGDGTVRQDYLDLDWITEGNFRGHHPKKVEK